MKKMIYTCDRCGTDIHDVAYTITCYAEDLNPGPLGGVSSEVAMQNVRQNLLLSEGIERHLCQKCKDEITDGVFVL